MEADALRWDLQARTLTERWTKEFKKNLDQWRREVGKEQRYYVCFGQGYYLERGYADSLTCLEILETREDWLKGDGMPYVTFTEVEIKAMDPRYMAFAVPVQEEAKSLR